MVRFGGEEYAKQEEEGKESKAPDIWRSQAGHPSGTLILRAQIVFMTSVQSRVSRAP